MAELVPAGVEAALAAFRTGLHSLKMQRDIEPAATEAPQSWSFLAGMTEREALETIGAFVSTDVGICSEMGCSLELTSFGRTSRIANGPTSALYLRPKA
jgi:hypothetical protein